MAASVIGLGTPCSAATRMIMKKPVFFQTSMKTIEAIAACVEVSHCGRRQADGAEVVVDDAELIA